MRIYLDMCCFNRPYDDQSQLKISLETQSKLHIQAMIKDEKLKLITSYMLRYECSKNPFEMRRNTIFDFITANTYAYVGDEHKAEIEARQKKSWKRVSNSKMHAMLHQQYMQHASISYPPTYAC